MVNKTRDSTFLIIIIHLFDIFLLNLVSFSVIICVHLSSKIDASQLDLYARASCSEMFRDGQRYFDHSLTKF